MAKKQSNFKPVNTSNIDTDVFIKGMTKDSHRSFVGKESWTHCRNCINNSARGDAGTVGNEPANLICVNTGYTIIGAIYLYGDKWIIYSTDNNNSEIGLFDDSQCEYNTLINDKCLNFNKFNLITGASKENYDCTWQVYWDDGLNPSRTINLGNKDEILENNYIPYVQVQVSGIDINGDPCIEFENVEPLQLDCDLIRLAPLMKTPCVKLSKADSPGQLLNGSYQAYIAYLVNEQQIGNYVGVSNIQPLFDQGGTACSLDIEISNLDTNFSDYKLVMLINNQQQPQAIQVGIYSTHQTKINIDYISENKATAAQVDPGTLPLQTPAYERSDQMVPVNDYLLRIGPTTNFDFNYQPLANKITAKWVSTEYPAEYYVNGGNKPTFMRDEQYAFFIRFIYHTGDKSFSYHIPGRAYLTDNPEYGDEKGAPDQTNVLNNDEDEIWKVNNTSFVDEFDGATVLDDGGVILSKGQMGYWESSEFYPAEDPHGRWEELCGQPIRHHKFPDEQTDETVNRSSGDNQSIRILGVEFDNIAWPVDNEGNIINNIVGYEILVGSRQGNKSILSKGIIRNMKQYPLPEQTAGGNIGADNPISLTSVGVMANYPFNDLRSDSFLTLNPPNGGNSFNPPMPVNLAHCGTSTFAHGCSNFYTFHSPETSFQRPFLNPSELKSYGINTGLSQGYFRPSEGHPKNVLIRDFVAILAAFIGIGFAISKQRGKRKTSVNANVTQGAALDAFQLGLQAPMLPLSPLGIETQFTTSPIVPGPLGLGAGLGEVAYMQSTATLVDGISVVSSPLTIAGSQKVEFEGTDVKSLPNILGIISGLFTTMHYAAVGGQEVVDLVYNIAGEHQYAYKYNSYGLYSQTVDIHDGTTFRQNITKSRYVGNTFQDFGSEDVFTNIRINNLYRPATVVVQTNGTADSPFNSLPMPVGLDQSRNSMGDLGIHAFPTADVRAPIAAHYVALKFAMDNQYGQLDGIKQVPIPCSQRFIRQGTENTDLEFEVRPPDLIPYLSREPGNLIPGETFKSEVLFGGDVYVNRYSEKVIMPFFWEFLNGQPDNFGFDYRDYQNVPYPRYYMDTNKYDMHNLFSPIINFDFNWSTGNAIPSAMRNMDKEGDVNSGNLSFGGSITTSLANTITQTGGAAQGSSLFVLRRAYMYTHNSGINDFFVESELNVAHRAQGEGKKEKYYDWSRFTDLNGLFHSDIIKEGNFYKYDYSLSKSNLISQLISYSLIQGRDYDPNVAATCYDHYTKRVLYSLQAFKEAKQDFWRVYLPNNYKDFKNAPTTIKPISKTGAMILFPHLAPLLFEGVDTLTTDLDTKITIGDGGLFSQPMKQITTADLPHEYGSCEDSRSVINTPAGIYYISQAQGKIFNVAGQGLNNIADAGMKQWFNTYLPSRLIQAFPEIEGSKFADNPVIGIGCQSVYDPNYDIVYFCKKDYEPCNIDPCLEFDPEQGFIINETECYGVDPIIVCEEGFTLTTDENGDPICEQIIIQDPSIGTSTETIMTSGPALGIVNGQLQPILDGTGWGQIGEPWHMCMTPDTWSNGTTLCPRCPEPGIDENGNEITYYYNQEIGQCCEGTEEEITEQAIDGSGEMITSTQINFTDNCVGEPEFISCAEFTGTVFDNNGDYDQVFIPADYGIEGLPPSLPSIGMVGSKYEHNLRQEWEEGISQKLAYPMQAGVEYTISFWMMSLRGGCFDQGGGFVSDTHFNSPASLIIYGTNQNCNDTVEPCDWDDYGAFSSDGPFGYSTCHPGWAYQDEFWHESNNYFRLGDTFINNDFLTDPANFPFTMQSIQDLVPEPLNIDPANLSDEFSTYIHLNFVANAATPGPYPPGYQAYQWFPVISSQQNTLDPVNIYFENYIMGPWDVANPTWQLGKSDDPPKSGFLQRDPSKSTNYSTYIPPGQVIGKPLGWGFSPSWGEKLWDSWEYSIGNYDYFEGYKDSKGTPFGDLPQFRQFGQANGCLNIANVNIAVSQRAANTWSYLYTGEPCSEGDPENDVTGPCANFAGMGLGNVSNVPVPRWNKYIAKFTPSADFEYIVFKSNNRPDKKFEIENHNVGAPGFPGNGSYHRPYYGLVTPGGGYTDSVNGVVGNLENQIIDEFVGTVYNDRRWPYLQNNTRFKTDSYLYLANIQVGEETEEIIETPFCFCPEGTDTVLASDEITPATPEDCVVNGGPGIVCRSVIYEDPTSEDVITNVPLEEGENFKDVSWTASYDPKIKGWISFHDWHPELTISSLNHFLTTKTEQLVDPYCPPGYTLNPITGLCEVVLDCPPGSVLVPNSTDEGLGQCCQTLTAPVDYFPGETNVNINGDPIQPIFLNNPGIEGPNGVYLASDEEMDQVINGTLTYADFGLSESLDEDDYNLANPLSPFILNGPISAIGSIDYVEGWDTCMRSSLSNEDCPEITASYLNFNPTVPYFTIQTPDLLDGFNFRVGSPLQQNCIGLQPVSGKNYLGMLHQIGDPALGTWKEGASQELLDENGEPNPLLEGVTYTGEVYLAADLSFNMSNCQNTVTPGMPPCEEQITYKGPDGEDITITVTSPMENDGYGSVVPATQPAANRPELQIWGSNELCLSENGSWCAAFNTGDVDFTYPVLPSGELVTVQVSGQVYVGSPDDAELLWSSGDISQGGTVFHNGTDVQGWQLYNYSFTPTKNWKYFTFLANALPSYEYEFNDNTFTGQNYPRVATNCYLCMDAMTPPDPGVRDTAASCRCNETLPDGTPYTLVLDDGIYETPATPQDCIDAEGQGVICVATLCTDQQIDEVEPSYESGATWKHNVRCDVFNNYYNVQHPWEIELVESIGQTVNTVRSIEYQLESYLHQPKLDEDGCILNYGCDDRWHDLNYNFDEAIIYNTEQVSGLLTLTEQTADVNDIVSYPIIGEADINILYSKVEQKYRFDQFWDITNDRSVPEPIFITQLNGYVRDLNEAYMNYNKPQLERKKFRHYVNNLILRKKVSVDELEQPILHTRKMILKLVNTKINLSVR